MKNVDDKMKQLITDNNILSYLHDLLSYCKSNEMFFESSTYIELFEKDIITIFKYLKRLIFTIISFITFLLIFKTFYSDFSEVIIYLFMIIIPLLYGKLIVLSKQDINDLTYQLITKKAAQFALDNYTYDEFIIFLDKYLSVLSSTSYIKQLRKR